jgi:hypothetical protein
MSRIILEKAFHPQISQIHADISEGCRESATPLLAG